MTRRLKPERIQHFAKTIKCLVWFFCLSAYIIELLVINYWLAISNGLIKVTVQHLLFSGVHVNWSRKKKSCLA